MSTPRQNPEVVLAWLDAMRRADLAAVEDVLEPEVTWRGLPVGAVCRNRDDVLDMLRADELHEGLRSTDALELVAGDGGDTVGDRLVDAGAEEAYERAARRLALTSLLPRVASLSSREQRILRGRYGLEGPVHTLRELGADLGISAERVRQLEQQALDTLHAAAT